MLSILSNALNRSNNRDCSRHAHLFLSYHLIQVQLQMSVLSTKLNVLQYIVIKSNSSPSEFSIYLSTFFISMYNYLSTAKYICLPPFLFSLSITIFSLVIIIMYYSVVRGSMVNIYPLIILIIIELEREAVKKVFF